MSLEASTLIIHFPQPITDIELIKALELYKSKVCKIGEENTDYYNALTSSKQECIYVSTAQEYVIIVGHPLIQLFIHTNPFSHIFKNSKYFFFFCESTSMLSGFVFGIGAKTLRRKYTMDGKYVKGYDVDSDFGEQLPEEEKIWDAGYQKGKSEYMNGHFDKTISEALIIREFPGISVKKISEIIYNKNINELPLEYLNEVNYKLRSSEIKIEFTGSMSNFLKEEKFRRINFSVKDEKIDKNSFYKDINGVRVFVLTYSFGNDYHSYTVCFDHSHLESTIKEQMIPYKGYGVPILELSTSSLSKMNGESKGFIYTKNDLNNVLKLLSEAILNFKQILNILESEGLNNFLTSSSFFKFCVNRIRLCDVRYNDFKCVAEMNYCLLNCLYHHSQNEFRELSSVFDTLGSLSLDGRAETKLIASRHIFLTVIKPKYKSDIIDLTF